MAMDFQETFFTVPRGDGYKSVLGSVVFPSRVRRAAIALNGFNVDYEGSEDHHIDRIVLDSHVVSIENLVVWFESIINFSDKNPDDSYSGYVKLIVVADLF